MTDLSLEDRRLFVGSVGQLSTGWWAMLFIIITEAAIFAFLQFSYYYIAVQQTLAAWPPPHGRPELTLSLPNTIILLLSSAAAWWGEHSIKRGNRLMLSIGLAVALLLGCVFAGIQGLEWSHKHFTYATHTYGSLYFTITGFHMAHLVVGLIVIAAMLVWSLLGYFNQVRHAAISTGALYWHFVDAVWLTIFFTFYIVPFLR
jgi:heme/copper-type cytochrome/quinol oxidase subunit 3